METGWVPLQILYYNDFFFNLNSNQRIIGIGNFIIVLMIYVTKWWLMNCVLKNKSAFHTF